MWQLIQFSPNIVLVQSIWSRNEAYILFSCSFAWSIIDTELALFRYDRIQCHFLGILMWNEYSEISVTFGSVLQVFWNSAHGLSILKSIFLWKLSNRYAIAPESSQIYCRLFEMNRCKFTSQSLMNPWCDKSARIENCNLLMLFFSEIIISNWNSNYFQSWMFLK